MINFNTVLYRVPAEIVNTYSWSVTDTNYKL